MITEKESLTKEAMDIIGVRNPYIMYLLMKIYGVKKIRLDKIDGKHCAVYSQTDIERLAKLWQEVKFKKV